MAQAEASGAAKNRRELNLGALAARLPEELGVFAALVILVTIIGVHNRAFVRPGNLMDLVASNSFFGIIALATVFLLALGEIDLSVGWNFNFSAVIAALAMVHGVNPWLAAGLGVLFGAGLGLANGLLAVGLQLPVIIVTLGTYSMFQGLSLVVNKSSRGGAAGRQRQLLHPREQAPFQPAVHRRDPVPGHRLRGDRRLAAGGAASNAVRLPGARDRE